MGDTMNVTNLIAGKRALYLSAGAVLVVASLALVIALGQASGDAPKNVRVPVPSTHVDLSASQLNAIRVDRIAVYAFAVEKQEFGTVSLAHDPALIQAESALIGAAATFRTTSKELARVRSLGQPSGISQKEMDQAAADQQTATAALAAARAALRALGKSDADIDQMIAKGRLPARQSGQTKWVTAYATDEDALQLRAGQKVRISRAASPAQSLEGRVAEVYASVDPSTHRVGIRCEITDPNNVLRPGMFVDVAIQTQAPVASPAIPANGVVREGDGTLTAWVTTDRRHFTQRTIKAGLQENGRVQVLQGLQAGELAVTDGALLLDNMLTAPPSD